jgi:hypothetical protein
MPLTSGVCELVLDANAGWMTTQGDKVAVCSAGGLAAPAATRTFVEEVFSKHVYVVPGGVSEAPTPLSGPVVKTVTTVLKAE